MSHRPEILAQAETVVMDKTGTLTKGSFEVAEVVCKGKLLEDERENSYVSALVEKFSGNVGRNREYAKDKLLEYAAYAEGYSNHPISKSLQRAYGKEIRKEEILNAEEKAGMGVITGWNGCRIYAGNEKLMKWLEESKGVFHKEADLVKKYSLMQPFNAREEKEVHENIYHVEQAGTICHVAVEKNDKTEYLGYIVISDELKEDAKAAVEGLKQAGIKRIVMLTGDALKTAKSVADSLGIREYHAELLPVDKVELTEQLLKENGNNKKNI